MSIDFPVLIVGGGSVGMSLAGELGWRGIRCLVVERAKDINPHPRANSVSNRTMEYYRRWGIDKRIAETGIPSDIPARYFWVSTLAGRSIHEIHLPSATEFSETKSGSYESEEKAWSPYLKTITGQNEHEAVLQEYVRTLPEVEIALETEFVSFEDHGDYVSCVLRDLVSGEERTVTCRYLAACDGGRSTVRETLQVPMSGRASIARFISIYFRSEEFISKGNFGHGNIYFPLHKDYRGFILNWDGKAVFTYHKILAEGQGWTEVDPTQLIRDVVGHPIDVEIKSVQPWQAHALVVDNYRPTQNSFLVGDAAHLFTPTGGLGMNTGVSDAIDLAWKLQAMLEGWGGDNLLASYMTERRPIGVRNTTEAASCFDDLYSCMQYSDELDAEGPESDAIRAELKASLVQQEKLIVQSGMLLGYRYSNSPIVVPDGTPEPIDHPRKYVPVARPGHRAPHVVLDDGTALMDHFGQNFCVLNTDPGKVQEAQRLVSAMQARNIPVTLFEESSPQVRAAYEADLVLIRPDLMVAWRSNTLPESPDELIDRITGY